MSFKKTFKVVLVADYYVAAGLLGVAGVLKLNSHTVGDLLQFFFDHDFIHVEQLIFISRYQPVVEIVICLWAFSGVGARYTAHFIGCLYFFFAGLIYYAADGYLFLPIDCGCFGEGEGSIALLLIGRNCALASLLFLMPEDLWRFTLLRFLQKNSAGAG